jgi:transketolase
MTIPFGPRRAIYTDISEEKWLPLSDQEVALFEKLDAYYRALCAILYNFAPTSGHPGGSISSGRFVEFLLFDTLSYDFAEPDRHDADIISYAAGHKALGLYAAWALRNEIVRIAANDLLPRNLRDQLRLEDLLGFRKNPITPTPLFKNLHVKALDGHPTPATPFVRLSTGASGVGVASSLGLALGAIDQYRTGTPYVHIVEGEGGLTPGRVAEALAFAGTSGLRNVVLHLDWNQASIDSDHVTREGSKPGDYVQWEPMELFHLHDWNAIYVPDGRDFRQIAAAQRLATSLDNGQPTAIVYRTTKGWQYGIEGRQSHGAGHKLCSAGYFDAVEPLIGEAAAKLPACEFGSSRCGNGADKEVLEACFWETLNVLRNELTAEREELVPLAERLRDARERVQARSRGRDVSLTSVESVYLQATSPIAPEEVILKPGTSATLRGQLGKVLGYYNNISHGSMFVAAADLLGSTSVLDSTKGFEQGFFHATDNPASRTLSVGGICEDAMAGILAGLSAYGKHIGVGSSYGAFLAPLGHIAARLHAIGNHAKHETHGEPYRPFVLVCAHAGLKTGEDGPTHADPQALQVLQENFPEGTAVTLTPWEPQEIYPLMSRALGRRPAFIAPFVTRPSEPVLDRRALGLAPAWDAVKGVYLLHAAKGKSDGTIVLQESGVTYAFVMDALPLLREAGIDLDVYYVASAELFEMLPAADKRRLFPEEKAREAMGITGFTMSTMYRWIRSDFGRHHTLHPFKNGAFLGSGPGDMVIEQAGLDGKGQYRAILRYVEELRAMKNGTTPVKVEDETLVPVEV